MIEKIVYNVKKRIDIFGVLAFGAVVFVWLYGIDVLNPEYDTWLFKGSDLTQHYIGWMFYRKGQWTVPFGLTDQLAYPSYTSVIFTDSIPLFAVLFKIFSPILSDTFQYFGMWGLICFMLQAMFAYLICREYGMIKINSFLSCIFFVFAPTVFERMYKHTALAGQWLILFTIYIFVRHSKDYKDIKKTSILWAIIAFLISSIHMYYLPMCGIFLVGYIFCSLVKEKKIIFKYVVPMLSFIFVLFINTYLLGGFSTGSDFSADGLGESSFNLNAFFSNKGYSKILPSLPKRFDLQYEGFSYIGMGMICLMLFFVITATIIGVKKIDLISKKTNINDFKLYGFTYMLICFVLVVMAASPVVTFGNHILFTFPDIDIVMKLWSIFRASGRLIWPVMYLLWFALLNWLQFNSLLKNKKTAVSIILLITLVIQLYDISPKYLGNSNFYKIRTSDLLEYDDIVLSKIDSNQNIKHVIWVSENYEKKDIYKIATWAEKNNCTMNRFYFARGIDVRENTKYSMDNLNDECVYIFKTDDYELMKQYDLNYYSDDEYTIGLTYRIENN